MVNLYGYAVITDVCASSLVIFRINRIELAAKGGNVGGGGGQHDPLLFPILTSSIPSWVVSAGLVGYCSK